MKKKKALIPIILFCAIVALAIVIPTSLVVASPTGGADDPPVKKSESRVKKSDTGKKKSSKGKKSKKGSKKKKKKDEFPKGDHEKQFRIGLGEEFSVKYTPHFAILYNADEKLIKSFIHRLEATYKSVYKLCDRVGVKLKKPKEKLVVIYCDDFHSYSGVCKQFTGDPAPEQAAGLYYRHPYNFSLFYDNTKHPQMREFLNEIDALHKTIKDTRDLGQKKAMSRTVQWYRNKIAAYQEKTNREVVQHEVAHQCLFNFGFHTLEARNPIWLAEGMATQFETPPGKSGAGFGALNQERLGMLRAMLSPYPPNLKMFILNPTGGEGMLGLDGYATSWGLLNFLLKRHSKEFPGFVQAVLDRSKEESSSYLSDLELFEKHFGPIDEQFQKGWENYIRSLPYKVPRL